MLLGFFVLLRLLVAEFAEVHQPANRRQRVRSDFDQIHAVRPRQIQCVAQGKDTQLLAINSDDPDFAGTDFTIDPDE